MMNREIKFRGKGIEEYDKDKWYYGSYFKYDEINYFCLDDGSRTEEINEKLKNNIKHKIIFEMQGDLNMENHIKLADVNPETVGQYTGLHDKNGKEIYEEDVVKITNKNSKVIPIKPLIAQIVWSEEYLAYILITTSVKDAFENLGDYIDYDIEVIGNVFDNPELLGGE